MSKKQLLIFPFNGNGIEALDCIDWEKFELLGFIDDDCSKSSEEYNLFSRAILNEHKDIYVLAVPGGPRSFKVRAEVIRSLNINPERFITAIHPQASIGRNARVGFNTLVMAGVVLTSNATVGNHVCILPNSVVHHDSAVKDYTLVGSNVAVAGGSTIEENCYIGSGSNIMNGITIGPFSLIGLGSNVIRDVEPNSRVAGNPAKDLNLQLV